MALTTWNLCFLIPSPVCWSQSLTASSTFSTTHTPSCPVVQVPSCLYSTSCCGTQQRAGDRQRPRQRLDVRQVYKQRKLLVLYAAHRHASLRGRRDAPTCTAHAIPSYHRALFLQPFTPVRDLPTLRGPTPEHPSTCQPSSPTEAAPPATFNFAPSRGQGDLTRSMPRHWSSPQSCTLDPLLLT